MGIKYKNIDKRSKLSRVYAPVQFNNTAGGFALSATWEGSFMVPFNCDIEKVLFANDVDITGSNGCDISICNATTDGVPMAVAGNGHFWSASRAELVDMTGSLAILANSFITLTPSASYVSAGSLLNFTLSATACQCNIGLTLVLKPAPGVS